MSLHRQTIRKKRKEDAIPTVALIGYTNAGKSTLLNALTGAGQITSSSLFTTLDPLSRNLKLPHGENIVISDTVGFLHRLPHHLIEAFKATLEEVVEADLLIHVLDVNHPQVYECAKAVFVVLKELQADNKPMVTALNKTDLVEDKTWLKNLKEDFSNSVLISAKLKQNLDVLIQEIQNNFKDKMAYVEIVIPHSRMDLVDLFYRQGQVKEIKYLQKGIKIKANLPDLLTHKLLQNKRIKYIH